MGSKSLNPKFGSVTISCVPRHVSFLSLEFTTDKNEDVIEPCYQDVLSWGRKHLTLLFVFQAVLTTTIISAISWHISVVRLSLIWAYGCKGTG